MIDIRHFFGLTADPFPQTLAPEDLFMLPGLKALLERFEYSVKLGAVSIVTGEVGSGKSTSLRYACSRYHPGQYRVIPMIAGTGSMSEFLRQFLLLFGEENRGYQSAFMIKKVRDILSDLVTGKKVPILVVDEAHLLRQEVLRQLHTLSQFDFDSKPVLPMVLCGQDQLIDKLLAISIRPLASRVVGRTHMDCLQLKDMKGYIEHHLRLAGTDKPLFAEEAILAIHQNSGGLLRKANIIARGAMMAAANEKSNLITGEHIRIANTEVL